MIHRILVFAAMLSVCFPATSDPAVDSYTFARLVSSEEVKYSQYARALSLEGWVYASYQIGTDGRVENARVLDSNGVESLNQALLDSLNSRIYEPATRDGEPIVQHVLPQRHFFMLEGKPREAGRKFYRKYNKSKSLIAEGNIAEARVILDELASIEKRSLFEELYLQALYVAYFTQKGDAQKAYQHTLGLLDFHEPFFDDLVEEDFFVPFLVSKYQYEVAAMMLGDALHTAQRLQQAASYSKVIGAVEQHASNVSENVRGKSHSMKVVMPEPVYGGEKSLYRVRLLKPKMQMTKISGRLDWLELHCDEGYQLVENELDQALTIPPGWGACTVAIYGDVGTSFTLTEFPA